MPENELLDSDARAETRWRPLADRLERGEAADALFPEVQQQFYGALRSTFKRWERRGVDPGRLFAAAASGRAALRPLVGQCWHDRHARLLQDVIASIPDPDPRATIRAFLGALWDQAQGFLRLDGHGDEIPDALHRDVDQMLERMTQDLLKNPSRAPRMPPRSKRPPDIDALLDEPLPRG